MERGAFSARFLYSPTLTMSKVDSLSCVIKSNPFIRAKAGFKPCTIRIGLGRYVSYCGELIDENWHVGFWCPRRGFDGIFNKRDTINRSHLCGANSL
jgi:hypothetical protein